jgi:hypothetical protein
LIELNNQKVNLTNDSTIRNLPYYHTILNQIKSLDSAGILKNFAGNCIAACDLFSLMLTQQGIENQIIECQVSICWTENGIPNFQFVGFDNQAFPGQVDTHTIIITKTEVPLLIDLSISHHLPSNHPFVIEKLNSNDEKTLAEFKFENYVLTYQPKKIIRLPSFHQKTLRQRLEEDKKWTERVKLISMLVFVSIFLGVLNFVLNVAIIYLKYFSLI